LTSSSSGKQESVNDLVVNSRQPKQQSDSEGPAADTVTEEEVDLQPTVVYRRTSTTAPSVPNIEETLEPLSSTSSLSEPGIEELEDQAPVSQSVIRRPFDKASDIGEEALPSFVPRIKRMTRTNTFSRRKNPVRTTSSILEEFVAQPSSASTSSESLGMEPKERLIEHLPSPEHKQRRMTTRRKTQPVEASSILSPTTSRREMIPHPEILRRQTIVATTRPVSRRATMSEPIPAEERRASEAASRSMAMSDFLYY
jgi:hypothetical protein